MHALVLLCPTEAHSQGMAGNRTTGEISELLQRVDLISEGVLEILSAAAGITKSFASHPTTIQLSEKAVMEWQRCSLHHTGWMWGLNF